MIYSGGNLDGSTICDVCRRTIEKGKHFISISIATELIDEETLDNYEVHSVPKCNTIIDICGPCSNKRSLGMLSLDAILTNHNENEQVIPCWTPVSTPCCFLSMDAEAPGQFPQQ